MDTTDKKIKGTNDVQEIQITKARQNRDNIDIHQKIGNKSHPKPCSDIKTVLV